MRRICQIFLFINFFLFFLLSPKNVQAVEICDWANPGCVSSSECTWCDGGTCVGLVERSHLGNCDTCSCNPEVCEGPCSLDPVWEYETCQCYCAEYTCYEPGKCMYPDECFEIDCEEWSAWSACYGGWQYKTCIDGPYEIEWRPCDNPNPTGTPAPTPQPSCTVSMPASRTISLGETASMRARPSSDPWSIDEVRFRKTGDKISDPNPNADDNRPYDTSVVGVEVGTSTVKARVVINGDIICEDTTTVTVTPPGPWWQVKDSDIVSDGNISSSFPISCVTPNCNPYLSLDGNGGYPGVPIYAGSLNIGSYAAISSRGWQANTNIALKRNYSYSYFERQIPSDTEIIEITTSIIDGSFFSSTTDNRTYRYKYDLDASLTINGNVTASQRKIILLLDGADLYINGKINLADGLGMFLVLAGKGASGNGGNIYISSSVGGTIDSSPDIEGLYFTENQIYTGEGDIPLQIRGSLAALDGINLERDLTDNSLSPAEYVEFAPDQILLMPQFIKSQSINWKEIAP